MAPLIKEIILLHFFFIMSFYCLSYLLSPSLSSLSLSLSLSLSSSLSQNKQKIYSSGPAIHHSNPTPTWNLRPIQNERRAQIPRPRSSWPGQIQICRRRNLHKGPVGRTAYANAEAWRAQCQAQTKFDQESRIGGKAQAESCWSEKGQKDASELIKYKLFIWLNIDKPNEELLFTKLWLWYCYS